MSFVRTIPTAIPRGVGVGNSRSIGNQSEFSVLMERGTICRIYKAESSDLMERTKKTPAEAGAVGYRLESKDG